MQSRPPSQWLPEGGGEGSVPPSGGRTSGRLHRATAGRRPLGSERVPRRVGSAPYSRAGHRCRAGSGRCLGARRSTAAAMADDDAVPAADDDTAPAAADCDPALLHRPATATSCRSPCPRTLRPRESELSCRCASGEEGWRWRRPCPGPRPAGCCGCRWCRRSCRPSWPWKRAALGSP